MAKEQKKKVKFSYVAPGANKVELVGDFTGWELAPINLKKSKSGVWSQAVSLPAGRYEYRLIVDGEWRDDPQCATRQPNQFGTENCVCIVQTPAATATAAVAAPEIAATAAPQAAPPPKPGSSFLRA